MAKRVTTAPIERMYARLEIDDEGCWVWPGATTGNRIDVGGYGSIGDTATRRILRVHRVSYEHHVGPIPAGMVIDHVCHDEACTTGPLCKHRRCWNPAHLVAKPHRQNSIRGNHPRLKTHRTGVCQRGHVFAVTGTYDSATQWGTTKRKCKACNNMTPAQRAAMDA